MMRSLLTLANPLSFLIVALAAAGLAVLGLYLVRWRFSADELRENHDVASVIFGAFGWLYAVVIAFVVFVTWTGYDDANKDLQLEASRALDLFYSAETFPDALKEQIQSRLIGYLNYVDRDELPKLGNGTARLHSASLLRELITRIEHVDLTTIRNQPVYSQALEHVDNIAELRRHRIFDGTNTVPAVIWLVLLFGGFITVAYTYFFAMRHLAVQYLMTAVLATMVSFILFLIFVLDHPFTGANRVSDKPIRQALEIMQSRSTPPAP